MSMKIVSDAHIPFVRELFAEIGDLVLIPGHEIDRDSVIDADALLIRTVTKIDATLLRGSSLRFLGSATAGTDHVDMQLLNDLGIHFANAPGGNADSVVEYVTTALVSLLDRHGLDPVDLTLGVVGCGQVGGRLVRRAGALGMRVLANDPPLEREAEREKRQHAFVGLDRILHECDVVSLHVPLTREGEDRTWRLMGKRELDLLAGRFCLFNTSRGGVVHEEALLSRTVEELPENLVLDVWEHEPLPDPGVQRLATLATPHIAGYSRDAKYRSTRMIARALADYFNLADVESTDCDPFGSFQLRVPDSDPRKDAVSYMTELVGQMYPLAEDHERMRALPEAPQEARAEAFRRLRSDYPARYGFDRYHLRDERVDPALANRLSAGLGIVCETTHGETHENRGAETFR
jgi:erythronate-4-phosphate dehydrogenase